MAHGWGIVPGRDKQQVDGLLHQRASVDVYIRSVFRESRVQCTEGITADINVATEVLFDRPGVAGNLFCKTADFHTIRQLLERRQLTRKASVHEHKLRGDARNPVRRKLLSR